jgi:serine/threonine protein kinase
MTDTIHPSQSLHPSHKRSDTGFITSPDYVQRDIQNDYHLGQQIGLPGQFGYALRGRRKRDNQEVAIKVIAKNKFKQARERQTHFSELRTEIDILQKLTHPNVIQLFDVYETYADLYIVTELCIGGELFDAIKEKGWFLVALLFSSHYTIFTSLLYIRYNKR